MYHGPVGGILGALVCGYMLIFAHYPFNLDIALSGLRTRSMVPETDGLWVRISGGIGLVYFLTPESVMKIFFSNPDTGFTILAVLSGIALAISFIQVFFGKVW